MCNRCASFAWTWQPPSARAHVAAFVVNHHRFMAGIDPPYAVVTARLDDQDDVLMPGAFRGDTTQLHVGLPLVAEFEDAVADEGTEFTVLVWRAAT